MPTRQPLSVLIVVSDPDTADSLEQLLELMGHRVRVAESGMEAIDVACDFPPDVAIINLDLTDMDGYEAARILCDMLSRRPLLIGLTGHTDTEAWSQVEGFDHHFLKPLAPPILFEVLARYECHLSAGE